MAHKPKRGPCMPDKPYPGWAAEWAKKLTPDEFEVVLQRFRALHFVHSDVEYTHDVYLEMVKVVPDAITYFGGHSSLVAYLVVPKPTPMDYPGELDGRLLLGQAGIVEAWGIDGWLAMVSLAGHGPVYCALRQPYVLVPKSLHS